MCLCHSYFLNFFSFYRENRYQHWQVFVFTQYSEMCTNYSRLKSVKFTSFSYFREYINWILSSISTISLIIHCGWGGRGEEVGIGELKILIFRKLKPSWNMVGLLIGIFSIPFFCSDFYNVIRSLFYFPD